MTTRASNAWRAAKAREAKILAGLRAGKMLSEIAKALGVPHAVLQYDLQTLGIRAKQVRAAARRERVAAMKDGGASQRQTARHLGVSLTAVKKDQALAAGRAAPCFEEDSVFAARAKMRACCRNHLRDLVHAYPAAARETLRRAQGEGRRG